MIMLCFLLMAMRNGGIDEDRCHQRTNSAGCLQNAGDPYKNVIQMSEVDKLV